MKTVTPDVTEVTQALVALQRRLTDLSVCLDWVLAQQEARNSACYQRAGDRSLHLTLPLRWLAERASDELAAAEDILHELRHHIDGLSSDERA